MKSSEIKFANPDLNNIDFEVIPNSVWDKFLSLLGVTGIAIVIAAYFLVMGLLPKIFGTIWIIFTILATYVIFKLFRWTKKRFHNPMRIVKDRRAPIVYLRSFLDDNEDDTERWDRRTSEELITAALKNVGPVLAVKDQHSPHRILGATRIEMGGNWRTEVKKLLSISQLVIVEANFTENLLWELESVKRIVPPPRLLISFMSRYEFLEGDIKKKSKSGVPENDYSHFKKFNQSFSEIFEISLPYYNTAEICFFYFDSDWKPYPVQLKETRTFFRWLNLIIYSAFSISIQRYKYHLPFWKIRRAILLILHFNGLIEQKKYLKEIDREQREMEKELANPSRKATKENKKLRLGELGLLVETREIDTGSAPAQSLLGKIDSLRPHRKLVLGIVACATVAFAGLGIYISANYQEIETSLLLDEAFKCEEKGLTLCVKAKCEEAAKISPKNPTAQRCIASAYFEERKYDKAIAGLNRTLELDPGDAEAYYIRANSYINLPRLFDSHHNYDLALSDLAKAKNLKPDEAKYFSSSGDVYFLKKDYDKASADLNRAVELDQNNPPVYYILSLAQEKIGQREAAVGNMTKAILLDPGKSEYFYDRGRIYLEGAEHDLGIHDFDRAIELAPMKTEAYYCRGLAYCLRKSNSKTSDYRGAIEDFDRAISIDKNFGEAYCNRSFAYSKLGETAKAAADYKMCKKLDPEKKK